MFRFWVRELLGWFLVLIGLGLFYVCFAMLMMPSPRIFEAPTLSIIGIVVFRGGIHLLKVAVAARLAMATPTETPKPPVAPIRPIRKLKSETPWEW